MRRLAILELKAFIDNSLENKNVIILGDLNDNLTDNLSENVFQPIIDDYNNYLFTDMEIALGDPNLWSFPNYPHPWSFPDSTYTYGSHIDHILITNELFDEFDNLYSSIQTLIMDSSLENQFFYNSSYDKFISDHRAVGIKLYFDNSELLKGDVNQDGILDVLDILAIIYHIIDPNKYTFNSDQLGIADSNGYAIIDVLDVLNFIYDILEM